jgi:hypothetical protein
MSERPILAFRLKGYTNEIRRVYPRRLNCTREAHGIVCLSVTLISSRGRVGLRVDEGVEEDGRLRGMPVQAE